MANVTSNFVLAGVRCEIVFQTRGDPEYYSFTATYEGAGQCAADIRQAATEMLPAHPEAGRVLRVCDLWAKLHMKAPNKPRLEAEAVSLLEGLNGMRISAVVEDEELDESSFSNADDTIDSRDVIARIEYLTDYLAENPSEAEEDSDASDELRKLQDLESQCEGYAPDWRYGETLIRDSYFEDYAEELANDTGMTNHDSKWPNNHIDWAAAADELKGDYTSVSFDGVDYWIR